MTWSTAFWNILRPAISTALRVQLGWWVACGFFFIAATDFTHHEDAVCVGVILEHLEEFNEVEAFDGVAADADACGLADAALGGLPDGFVGECARA